MGDFECFLHLFNRKATPILCHWHIDVLHVACFLWEASMEEAQT